MIRGHSWVFFSGCFLVAEAFILLYRCCHRCRLPTAATAAAAGLTLSAAAAASAIHAGNSLEPQQLMWNLTPGSRGTRVKSNFVKFWFWSVLWVGIMVYRGMYRCGKVIPVLVSVRPHLHIYRNHQHPHPHLYPHIRISLHNRIPIPISISNPPPPHLAPPTTNKTL